MAKQKMKMIHAYVPADMKANVEREATDQLTSVAAVVRQALKAFLCKVDKNQNVGSDGEQQ